MSGVQRVIAVDLDGTLTDRDCVLRFIYRELGSLRLTKCLLRTGPSLVRAASSLDRDGVKRIVTSWLSGRHMDELRVSGRRFVEDQVLGWVRSDTLAMVERLRTPDSKVVIVSASYDVYVEVVSNALGFDGAVATRLQSHEGRATGAILGRNCRGPEKVARLESWMSSNGIDRATTDVVALGDSAGDNALLAYATEAVRVKRKFRWSR